MDEGDVNRIADKLLVTKRRVYRRTLRELARRLGYRDQGLPKLSDEVLSGLKAEADDHARRIVDTYNGDLEQQASQVADLPNEKVEPTLTTWRNARQRKRARPIAITEAYTAHADATMSGFLDLGLPEDTLFDFGGHPELGDAAPECPICVALIQRNPWSLADVVRIGNPHPGCRQMWHLNTLDQRDLPPELPDLGQTLAGVVGRESLITRAGDRDAAVQFVADLNE